MPKKNKLENMNQTHGKLETFQPTTLDQIWGDTGQSKYGTMDLIEYQNRLTNMNKADLQAHATKVGLVPVDDRDRLVKRLLQEFKLHVAAYRQPSVKSSKPQEITSEVSKILSEGR